MSEESLEAPAADTAEQQADAVPGDERDDEEQPAVPLEADSADAAEQARGVGRADEDEYR
jgi:hypothetical protein